MNRNREIVALGLFLVSFFQLQAQHLDAQPTFIAPFDFPLTLSGGFGELRSNHFHGGIDFKTQGVVGKPIRNIAAGYVSRAVVTPGGYGQALYVTHANGYTSIHGHLLKFASPIQARVEAYQYEQECFSVDLKFEPDEFPFEAGQIIALSGNEGYSFGPHLHMEIRETESWAMIDPLQFYKHLIKDTTPPRASFIMVYPQLGKGLVNASDAKRRVPIEQLGTPIEAWGDVAFGIKAFDYMDGTHNHYGVRKVTLFVDGEERFKSTIDKVYPAENRMINAWTDYEEHRSRGKWFMRSHLLPGSNLHQLETDQSQGIVTIHEERIYRLRYELEDLYGNRSSYAFTIQGKEQEIPLYVPTGKQLLDHKRGNVIQETGMEMIIPRGALYHDVDLQCRVIRESDTTPRLYQLHDAPVPLHIPCSLQIRVPLSLVAHSNQYYMAQVRGKRLRSVGGTYEEGWIKSTIRELGTYVVAIDTLPPRITPLNQKQWTTGDIQFRVKDDETGIESYKAYVDGEFVLFGYDLKSNRLLLKDSNRLKVGKNRRLELYVTDRCGNETVVEYLF
ncbi:MAG: M23 family metallopeptidase [Phocaeicola sp.]